MGTAEAAITAAEDHFGLRRGEILAPSRGTKERAWARHVAVYLAHRLDPAASFTALGTAFGRDRTTIRHAVRRVEFWLGEGDDLADLIDRLEGEVRARTAAPV